MPELPEVEHLRRCLQDRIVWTRIVRAVVHRDDVTMRGAGAPNGNRTGARQLARRLTGRRIETVERHGKLLIIRLDDRACLLVHLGMSGQVLTAESASALPRRDHVHMVLTLVQDDGRHLIMAFRDPRRFGGLGVWSPGLHPTPPWDRFGPDALTGGYPDALSNATPTVEGDQTRCPTNFSTGPDFWRKCLSRTSQTLKAALLDQKRLAGIGNIYADEILFRARLHPMRRASSLRAGDWSRLATSASEILHAAVEAGGSTLRDYRDSADRPGTFVAEHRVYGRTDQPCARCGRMLVTSRIASRTTVHCPRCQRAPRVSRSIPRRSRTPTVHSDPGRPQSGRGRST